MISPASYRPDIDGLRALAVISVVLFHAFPNAIPGGFIGVDIFFVISGFLITSIILKGLTNKNFSFLDFYTHRTRRIFPALITVLGCTYVFGYATLLPDELKSLGEHLASGAIFIENLQLQNEIGYFDQAIEVKPLMHLWSLAIEEQFYILYPLFLWVMSALRISPIVSIGSVGIASFTYNILATSQPDAPAYYLPQTRFWELLAGGILASVQHTNKTINSHSTHPIKLSPHRVLTRFSSNITGSAGLALLLASLWIVDSQKPFPGWWALPPVLGTILIILSGPQTFGNRWLLGNRWMVWVGLISYPIYLWHWPILAFSRIIQSTPPSTSQKWVFLALTVALAWLTYKFIESPIRFKHKGWKVTASLCLGLVACAAIGSYSDKRNGFSHRIMRSSASTNAFIWPQSAKYDPQCDALNLPFHAKFCQTTGKPDPETMLIGDSHANRLGLGLKEYFNQINGHFLQLGEPGCLPFFDVKRTGNRMTYKCTEIMNQALQLAISSAEVKTVILSSRGALHVEGHGFGPQEERFDSRITRPDLADDAQNPAVFEQAMRDTLQKLTAGHKAVVFVIDVPELDFDPLSCIDIPTPSMTRRAQHPSCDIPRPAVDHRNKRYWDLVRKVTNDFPSVRVFSPIPYLCDASTCRARAAEGLLYTDNHHLSTIGSKLIADALVREMKLH